jgi:hypothetical protein
MGSRGLGVGTVGAQSLPNDLRPLTTTTTLRTPPEAFRTAPTPCPCPSAPARAGKMWRDGDAEPTHQTLIQDPTPAAERGRGVGFYEYLEPIVTFFDLTISFVPP